MCSMISRIHAWNMAQGGMTEERFGLAILRLGGTWKSHPGSPMLVFLWVLWWIICGVYGCGFIDIFVPVMLVIYICFMISVMCGWLLRLRRSSRRICWGCRRWRARASAGWPAPSPTWWRGGAAPPSRDQGGAQRGPGRTQGRPAGATLCYVKNLRYEFVVLWLRIFSLKQIYWIC